MSTPNWLRASLLSMEATGRLYALYDRLYNGTLEEDFTSQSIQQALKSTKYYNLNFSRTIVDSTLERTEISGIISPDDKARTILDDFWEANQLDFESKSAHERAYTHGNSVIICLPDEDDNLTAYVHSARDVGVFYDPSKPRNKSHAVHTFSQYGQDAEGNNSSDDEYFIAVVYFPTTIQKWISVTPIVENRVDFATVEMRLLEEVDTPIDGVIPVFHLRTARTPIGRSRLVDASGPQLMINDVVTSLMAAVKRAGFRQRYLLTDAATPPTGDNFSDSYEDTPESGLDSREYQAGEDTLFHFAGNNVQVGSFDVSESSNFLEPIDRLVAYLAKISDVPTGAFDSSATPPSGEALRRSEMPLTKVVESCQALFEATWKELFNFVLTFNNVSADATVAWEHSAETDADYWSVAEQKYALGMPREAIFVEAGYSQDLVDEWFSATPEPQVGSADLAITASDIIPPGTEPDLTL